jgi:glycosyltransferase involved in cell wall biosynthesis
MHRRICIVTPGNLAFTPRVLKEADALQGAGYDVTVVAGDYNEDLRSLDDEVAARVSWRAVRVRRTGMDRAVTRAARGIAKVIDGSGARVGGALAAYAEHGAVPALRTATAAIPADLYIAHYVAALPAAAAAARRHRAILGFDAEDFHSGEGGTGSDERFRMKMVAAIEGAILPSCAHATAASPMIAEAYAGRYRMISPVSVLNVFPRDMAPPARVAGGKAGHLRAYWFSQTIGLDRGLQSFLHAMARSRTPIALDIRGRNRWGHGDSLMTLARQLGVADRVTLLPPAPPQDMVRLAAPYDVGLSLETDANLNRGLCLTNKIFTYLLAGIPVLMSDTPAQRALAPALGEAAQLISLDDHDGMAAALDRLAVTPNELERAKAAAWALGQERYNWESEQGRLLESVDKAFRRHDKA